MEIKQYIFQSPYSSQVQIGRPDPMQKNMQESTSLIQNSNETLKKADTFAQTQKQEITPNVSTDRLLDTYA